MSLRGKFHLLLAIFGISIVVNLAISVWCVRIYMEAAIDQFDVLTDDVQHPLHIQALLDDLVSELETRAQRTEPLDDNRYRILCRNIKEQISDLPSTRDLQYGEETQSRDRLLELGERLFERSVQCILLVENGQRKEAERLLSEIKREYAHPMLKILGELARRSNASISNPAAEVADKQTWVTVILSVNSLVVFLLVAVGIYLVRYGMLRPVEALKTATEKHAAGDLEYRIPHHSNDELGALSRQVNWMADSLASSQRRLVEQERLAAVGEVTSSVAHNIRNPLASIRASIQSWMNKPAGDNDFRASQARAIETVDSLTGWLHELLMVNTPIELKYRSIGVRMLVDRVVKVIRPFAERRGVRIEVEEEEKAGRVFQVDVSRLRRALSGVVDNAIEASPRNVEVRIIIGDCGEQPEQVELRVIDSGPGIQPEIRNRIAKPYFTTKAGGTGIGLYLAKRTVAAHGGTIEFQENPGGGTIVVFCLPTTPRVESGVGGMTDIGRVPLTAPCKEGG
ncbi:MAG: HAMP domain-containing protein [Phycisphaerae bacterium]|nr:HAMP domain-containing protein [Phycisphaerae bacterium]